MISIIQAIQHLLPEAQCAVVGIPQTKEEYLASMSWLDDRPMPTWEQVQDAMPVVQAQQEAEEAAKASGRRKIAEASGLTPHEMAALGL